MTGYIGPDTFVQLPGDTAAFTGRGVELDRLNAIVDEFAGRSDGGAVVICAVDGMAGIGKPTSEM